MVASRGLSDREDVVALAVVEVMLNGPRADQVAVCEYSEGSLVNGYRFVVARVDYGMVASEGDRSRSSGSCGGDFKCLPSKPPNYLASEPLV